MNFDKRPTSDREYMEMLYSLITEMNGVITTQLRSMNNNIVNSQRIILDLQNLTAGFIADLKTTRDHRYQEEIDNLELQMDNLKRQLDEKRVAKSTPSMTTSQEIRTVALDVITKQRDEEKKKWAIDWAEAWRKFVPYAIGAIVFSIILYLLPEIGRILVEIFSK